MNDPGDIPATNVTVLKEQPCGPLGFLPSFGMSCRGRAEAFARRLQSRLRTLGSQNDDESPTADEEPIINNETDNAWLAQDDRQQVVTNLQPLRHMSHEADAFFDFDCESPGSPVDECEYSRLIETASTTPQNAPESGYVCASPITENGSQGSHTSSSEEPYFDPEASENEDRSLPTDYYDCIESKRDSGISVIVNGGGHYEENEKDISPQSFPTVPNDSSESSESLPPSQDSSSTNATSTTQTSFTFTGCTASSSNSTLQDVVLTELQQHSADYGNQTQNGYSDELKNGHYDGEQINENLTQETSSNQYVSNGCNGERDSVPEVIVNRESDSNESQDDRRAGGDENFIRNDFDSTDRKSLSAGDTDDDDDCRPQRVRRCSSLKTGKTPPGTPGRKKIVRFADVLGLDLADVKTFLDEIPTVPKSAYEDLDVAAETLDQPIQLGPRLDKILMPLFQQPAGLPNFLDIVREKQVSLENAAVTDTITLTITGSVRVRNLDFNKSVHIRYSLDNWRSFADLKANYVPNSCDGFSDKFTFILFGNSLNVGQRLEFAVRFQCRGQQFWDNNYGANYCFQCLPASSITTNRPIIPHHHASAIVDHALDSWCGGSFY